jgi:excisionase family DNA binding protein
MSSNIIVKRICENCHKEFEAKTTTTRFCSKACNSRNYKKLVRELKVKHVEQEFKEKKLEASSDINLLDIKPYLSIKDVCLLLGASDSTVRKLIKHGTVKTFQMGGKHIIRRTDVENLFTDTLKLKNS